VSTAKGRGDIMNDKDFVLCLLIEDFLASIDDLENAGIQEECDELIRAFGYDKKRLYQ
jgi:hypothetical protein